jgi:hypothetical protein
MAALICTSIQPQHYPACRARCDKCGMRRVVVPLVLRLRIARDEGGVHRVLMIVII